MTSAISLSLRDAARRLLRGADATSRAEPRNEDALLRFLEGELLTTWQDGHTTGTRELALRLSVSSAPPLVFVYTNWKGVRGVRTVRPLYLWHGQTQHHPTPQWLLHAFDIDKQAERDFSLASIEWKR